MAKASNKNNMVKVEIVRPFHIGIDTNRVDYQPGKKVEMEAKQAARLVVSELVKVVKTEAPKATESISKTKTKTKK